MRRVLDPPPVEELLRLRDPHPGQIGFINSPCKRKIIRAGRRGGKTTGVAILAVREFQRGKRVLYGVPTQEQIERFWYEVTEALRGAIDAGRFYKNELKHSIEMLGSRSKIRAKTCWNADTLRGDDADLLILDEFQLMNEDAWRIVGAPMLLDNNGDAVFIYTPPSLHSRSSSKANDPQHAAKMFKQAAKDTTGRWGTFHFSSHDNPYLSKQALADISMDMTASAIRQEIMAEDSDEVPGALWKHEWIDKTRVRPDEVPELERVVVGVDPSGSGTNEAGIVVAGGGRAPKGWKDDGLQHAYVMADASLLAPTPRAWAQAAVNQYWEHRADRLYGERNFGGDMVESTIRQVETGNAVSYKDANATRGKTVRAEPVAAACENGRVHHVGMFEQLETEMCTYLPGDKSPNRLDAMVWAVLPLIEGEGVLGLIDYLRDGSAQEDLDTMDKVRRSNTLVKPMIADAAPHCPECQAVTVVRVAGGELKCNQCGIQWKDPRTKPTDGQGMTRTQFLAKADEKRTG